MTDRPASAGGHGGEPDVPPEAATVFAECLGPARRFATLLAGPGVERGLIGPREQPRLWSRHLVNCALVADLLPVGARVVDVGAGAGLPGVVLAIRRPDLRVDLVEPMLRRTQFLAQVVDELELSGRVRIVRGRAEEPDVVAAVGRSDWVTARAVAPLDRLVRWCLPLLAPGGHLLALKGARAGDEAREHRAGMRRLGAGKIEVRVLGQEVTDDPTWVVDVERVLVPLGRRGQRGQE